jgi:hypothetical protein
MRRAVLPATQAIGTFRNLDVVPGKTHYGVIDREFRWFIDTGKMSWDGYLELRETEHAPEQ